MRNVNDGSGVAFAGGIDDAHRESNNISSMVKPKGTQPAHRQDYNKRQRDSEWEKERKV